MLPGAETVHEMNSSEKPDLSPSSLQYAGEGLFWKTIGSVLLERHERELPPLFESLSLRALALDIPVTFGGSKTEAWALVCRMFMLYHERMPVLGRRGYRAMIAGARQVSSAHFANAVLKRLAANIAYPSSPGRSIFDSLVDTFLVNGLAVTEKYLGSSMDGMIIETSLADRDMMDLGRRIATPPEGVWEEARLSYASRRPGFFTRGFLDIVSRLSAR